MNQESNDPGQDAMEEQQRSSENLFSRQVIIPMLDEDNATEIQWIIQSALISSEDGELEKQGLTPEERATYWRNVAPLISKRAHRKLRERRLREELTQQNWTSDAIEQHIEKKFGKRDWDSDYIEEFLKMYYGKETPDNSTT